MVPEQAHLVERARLAEQANLRKAEAPGALEAKGVERAERALELPEQAVHPVAGEQERVAEVQRAEG